MKVGELRRVLDQFDDEADVFYKLRPSVGNVGEIFHVYPDVYTFFGLSLPCVILDSDSQPNNANERDRKKLVY